MQGEKGLDAFFPHKAPRGGNCNLEVYLLFYLHPRFLSIPKYVLSFQNLSFLIQEILLRPSPMAVNPSVWMELRIKITI